jgi:hypothetical protein
VFLDARISGKPEEGYMGHGKPWKNSTPERFRKTVALFVFVCGFALGLGAAALWFTRGKLGTGTDATARNINEAQRAQREAEERAGRLQEELDRIAGYARDIEERTRTVETGISALAEQLDGASYQGGAVRAGIERAQNGLEESGELLGELRLILHGLQDSGGSADIAP